MVQYAQLQNDLAVAQGDVLRITAERDARPNTTVAQYIQLQSELAAALESVVNISAQRDAAQTNAAQSQGVLHQYQALQTKYNLINSATATQKSQINAVFGKVVIK